ncbi:uncharacterized protein [Lolium perenne]|uniref:uncharacterized protein n=1 Tax=Lolium perenne TaxID=4522 RepID=UPI0021F68F99|nr:uncharacterized protein LOC127338563 [Lolium perenne]
MEAKWVALPILVLLAMQIQPVYCPEDPMSSPHDDSTQLSSNCKDPCENSSIVCSAMVSFMDMFLPWFSSIVSFVILFCPFLRIKDMKPNTRTYAQTLFCWFLYLGFWDYIIWIFYFWKCHYPRYSAFPILMMCISGFGIHAFLSIKATLRTSAMGDHRVRWITILTFCFIGGGVAYRGTQIIGWTGVALSVLSHFCRIASTEYHNKINWFLFLASVVGSVNGFLWLIHPQLCISREYKNCLIMNLVVTRDSDLVAY